MVIDWSNVVWNRVIFNETEYDMSGIALRSSAIGVGSPHVEIMAAHYTNINNNLSIYVDDAIFTQNEPG